MSYARFSEGDVYVFGVTSGEIECMCCALNPCLPSGWPESFFADGPARMLDHMREHIAAGHNVPEDCIERLQAEAVAQDGKTP